MTVRVNKPAVNLREELASLRNQGGYSEQQFYFDGLVTNGDFATDTNWTKGTGWTIGSGVATHAAGTGSDIEQAGALTAGKTYYLALDVVAVRAASTLYVMAGLTNQYTVIQAWVTAGTKSFAFIGPSNGKLSIRVGGPGDVDIDNISVYETDGTDVIHTMPKGWVPKDVFEDGLLQREGAADDYEVVYDGFGYKVKPTVAPTATTQTCVIGVKA